MSFERMPSGRFGWTCVRNNSDALDAESEQHKCHSKCAVGKCVGPKETDCEECRKGLGFVGEWKEEKLVKKCKELEFIGDI